MKTCWHGFTVTVAILAQGLAIAAMVELSPEASFRRCRRELPRLFAALCDGRLDQAEHFFRSSPELLTAPLFRPLPRDDSSKDTNE